ncbi:hypothetical protein M413DRAFT_432892 [Hebeloma cylindrosporum]|uniref:Ricin B lectin domain-containing protein n=1 Tax=Hebeloma cylindrosporum TaxID=76867 RepID=A0A0C2Y1V6_HEBCY|nr:hypothetical protein M413DRAFT_432892 [Hebeloma cylindrosporum h7]
MPLVPNTVYTIHNDLTHTVLDFSGLTSGKVLARGWGWHGRNNQQWKLIRVGAPDSNAWKLQNQQENPGRFLSRQPNHHDRRLVGVTSDADATFVIQRIAGPSERYRILGRNNGPAITLITGAGPGEGVHNIPQTDQVLDLDADGPPIAIQAVEGNDKAPKYRAQLWSFIPVAPLPVEEGSYQIVNAQTGLVLDLTGNSVNDPVHGVVSQQGVDQRWIVEKDQNSDSYTLKNSRVADRFLAPQPGAAPENNANLSGRAVADAARFTIRKVPGTQLYKIFFDSFVTTDHSARGLALNLANAAPNAAPVFTKSLLGASRVTLSATIKSISSATKEEFSVKRRYTQSDNDLWRNPIDVGKWTNIKTSTAGMIPAVRMCKRGG